MFSDTTVELFFFWIAAFAVYCAPILCTEFLESTPTHRENLNYKLAAMLLLTSFGWALMAMAAIHNDTAAAWL